MSSQYNSYPHASVVTLTFKGKESDGQGDCPWAMSIHPKTKAQDSHPARLLAFFMKGR